MPYCVTTPHWVNTLRLRQIGRHFPDDIFRWIFLNENVWISIKISLKFVLRCQINNIPALVQIMAWRRPGDKPLSEPVMFRLLTHICVTRPQWVKHWSFITAIILPSMSSVTSYDHDHQMLQGSGEIWVLWIAKARCGSVMWWQRFSESKGHTEVFF